MKPLEQIMAQNILNNQSKQYQQIYIAFYINTCSGIQNPGMEKDWRRSEPQTTMTLRDSNKGTRKMKLKVANKSQIKLELKWSID